MPWPFCSPHSILGGVFLRFFWGGSTDAVGRAFARGFCRRAATAQPAQHQFAARDIFFAQQLFQIFQPLGIGLSHLIIAFKAQHVVSQLHVLLPQGPAQPSQHGAKHRHAAHQHQGRHKAHPAHTVAAPGAVITHQNYTEVFAVLQTILTGNVTRIMAGRSQQLSCHPVTANQ